jgi:hypothetical protein
MKLIKVTIIICFGAVLIAGTEGCDKSCITGKGNTVQQYRFPGSFSGINFSTDGSIYVSQDSATTFSVTAQQNIIDDLITRIQGDELEIYNDHCLKGNPPIIVNVTSPVLSDLSLSGVGAMYTAGKIFSDEISISVSGTGSFDAGDSIIAPGMHEDLSGTGSITLIAGCTNMNSENSGTGSITLAGYGEVHTLNTSGTGDFHGLDFITKYAAISISGSGNAEVNVTDTLDVTISGNGNVYYKGTPVLTTHINGSGSVIHVN